MGGDASLKITGLNCGYRKKRVLQQLDLPELPAGQLVLLLGPNAAGKSTLLKAISGIISATGSISFGGRDLLQSSWRKRSRPISYMPQKVPGDVNLTVMEAVLSALKASPFDRVDAQSGDTVAMGYQVLEDMDIAHLANRPLNTLSGGQLQLASLARTIVRQSAILLLDEPISALDLQHQLKVMLLAKRFAREGRLVIMVLHDLNLALRWADQVIVLHEGKLVSAGKPTDAITPILLKTVYHVEARIERCSKGLPLLMIDG